MKKQEFNKDDLAKYLLKKEEAEKISKEFHEKYGSFLKKNINKMFTTKGKRTSPVFSTTFGTYEGKQFGLYIGKNNLKNEKVKKIILSDLFYEVERNFNLINSYNVHWHSNFFIDQNTKEIIEIEFIPLAYRGEFLLEILNKYSHILDVDILVYTAAQEVGQLLQESIKTLGFTSTYPRVIDFDVIDINELQKEMDESDFFVELRWIGKNIFYLKEEKLIADFSESDLERVIGLELIKEGIPFELQYEIKDTDDILITVSDFFIFRSNISIAVFCDSKKYHIRKKGQPEKDMKINKKLRNLGIEPLRFSEKEIDTNIQACIEKIKERYLGEYFALSLPEVYLQKINELNEKKLHDFPKQFLKDIKPKLEKKESISTIEEKILNDILKKYSE